MTQLSGAFWDLSPVLPKVPSPQAWEFRDLAINPSNQTPPHSPSGHLQELMWGSMPGAPEATTPRLHNCLGRQDPVDSPTEG